MDKCDMASARYGPNTAANDNSPYMAERGKRLYCNGQDLATTSTGVPETVLPADAEIRSTLTELYNEVVALEQSIGHLRNRLESVCVFGPPEPTADLPDPESVVAAQIRAIRFAVRSMVHLVESTTQGVRV